MLECNQMVQASREGNKPSLASIIFMPFLFNLTLSIGNVVSDLLGSLLFRELEENLRIVYMQYLQYSISFALAAVIVLLFVSRVQGRSVQSIGFFKTKAILNYFKGVGMAFIGIVAIMSILQFKGALTITTIQTSKGIHLGGLS